MAKQHSDGAEKDVSNKVPAPLHSSSEDESTDDRSGATALIGVVLFMAAIVSITTIAFYALEPKFQDMVDKYRESKRTTPDTAPESHAED